MKIITLVVAFFVRVTLAFATAQTPDLFIIGKDTFHLYATPLEEYFIQAGNRELPGFSGCGSTACWRGYQAIWRLESEKIYLTTIRSCWPCEDNRSAKLEEMFGNAYVDGKVFADWVHGKLSIPYGERVQYVHMGFASRYDKEKVLEIDNGTVVSIKDYSNIEHDLTRLNRFTQLDTVFHVLNKEIKWNRLPKDEEDEWWEDVEITITKRGSTRIAIPEYIDKKYLKEVRRVLSKLRWEIVSRQGKPIEETYYLEFEFDFKNRIVKNARSSADD